MAWRGCCIAFGSSERESSHWVLDCAEIHNQGCGSKDPEPPRGTTRVVWTTHQIMPASHDDRHIARHRRMKDFQA
jgi:hypothetical protein